MLPYFTKIGGIYLKMVVSKVFIEHKIKKNIDKTRLVQYLNHANHNRIEVVKHKFEVIG